MKILILFVTLLLATATSAMAHVGHVGDLAGHSHWIGVGAVVAAGLVLAALGLTKSKEEASDEDSSEEAVAGEVEGDTA